MGINEIKMRIRPIMYSRLNRPPEVIKIEVQQLGLVTGQRVFVRRPKRRKQIEVKYIP